MPIAVREVRNDRKKCMECTNFTISGCDGCGPFSNELASILHDMPLIKKVLSPVSVRVHIVFLSWGRTLWVLGSQDFAQAEENLV